MLLPSVDLSADYQLITRRRNKRACIRCNAGFLQGLNVGLDGLSVIWRFTGLMFLNRHDLMHDESESDIFMDHSGSASEQSLLTPAECVSLGRVLLSRKRNGGLNPQFVARLFEVRKVKCNPNVCHRIIQI